MRSEGRSSFGGLKSGKKEAQDLDSSSIMLNFFTIFLAASLCSFAIFLSVSFPGSLLEGPPPRLSQVFQALNVDVHG